jgi:hypothetical protein
MAPGPGRVATPSPRRGGLQIGLYFTTLTLASGLGHPDGLLRLPIQFWLKDGLDVSPQGLAIFEALACAPVYLAFAFGFLRDHWRPFRWHDRGYLVLSSLVAIACYFWLATGRVDYGRMLVGVVLAGAGYQLMHAAGDALMTLVAQHHLMTGRLSAVNEFGEAAAGILAAIVGGWMVSHASMSSIFVIAAGCSAVILVQGFWKPRAIFAEEEKFVPRAKGASVGVLFRHPALKPTALIILLWSFSPGYHTPLLYYLTEEVGISSAAYGVCQAADYVGITVATILYAWLCHYAPLKRLLWWSISLSIFPGLIFLLVRSAHDAVAASFLLALLVGFLNTSIGDLLMRASPVGLEGSYRMFGVSAFAIGGALGDVSGAWVYERGGLVPCLIIEAAITICIFPALRRLPHALIASREAE